MPTNVRRFGRYLGARERQQEYDAFKPGTAAPSTTARRSMPSCGRGPSRATSATARPLAEPWFLLRPIESVESV